MAAGPFSEVPHFTTVWAPPTYPATTAGAVSYVALRGDRDVLGYLWAAVDGDGAGFLPSASAGADGLEAAVLWVAQLREWRARGQEARDAFAHWARPSARREPGMGEVDGDAREADGLPVLYGLAGGPAERVPSPPTGPEAGRPPAAAAARAPVPPLDAELRRILKLGSADTTTGAAADTTTGAAAMAERQVELLDRALAAKPVPEDVAVWRAASPASFDLDLPYLPGTLQQDPAYLAVALTRYEALAEAPMLLRLRVPAGTPAFYLNALAPEGLLPAPALLLGRGLTLRIHDVRRREARWHVQAVILPTDAP